MVAVPEEQAQAEQLLQELKRTTSFQGQGLQPTSDFEQQFQEVIRARNPNINVILMAGSIPIRQRDANWARAVASALEDQFRLKLNQDLIETQIGLAESNDRLGNRMLFAAWAGVAATSAGVLVAFPPVPTAIMKLIAAIIGLF